MTSDLTANLMKQNIDQEVLIMVQKVKIQEQKNTIKMLEEECAALREQLK